MKQTEAEFYERLNSLDKETSMLLEYCACALSGFIVGIIAGYFAGIFFPIGG